MLLKQSLGWPIYVSAKRTHRFRRQKQGLSDCEANRSDRNVSRFSVGSFWENEPTGGLFFLVFWWICTVSECSCNSMGLEMLRGGAPSFDSIRQAQFWDTTGRNHRTPREGTRPTTGDLRSDKMRGRETGAQRERSGPKRCGVGRPAHNEARPTTTCGAGR
jgi:hypothetical protein